MKKNNYPSFIYLCILIQLSLTAVVTGEGTEGNDADNVVDYELSVYCWADGTSPDIRCQQEGFYRYHTDINIFTLNTTAADFPRTVSKIQRFRFHPTPFNLDALSTFCDASSGKLHLSELTIWLGAIFKFPTLWYPVSDCLSQILNSSSDSLLGMTLWDPMGFLPTLKLPRLRNLTELALPHLEPMADYLKTLQEPSIFPRAFRFAYHTPSLRTVSLSIDDEDTEAEIPWFSFFPPSRTGPAQSVQRLSIHSFVVGHDELIYLFPNVRNLVLGRFSNFPGKARDVWKWTGLKGLELGVNVRLRGNRFPELDASFTGFSGETCREIYARTNFNESRGRWREWEEELEVMREGKSILDLQGLRKLKLVFRNQRHTSDFYSGFEEEPLSPEPPNGTIILSRVTGQFAFKLMPRLRVTISRFRGPFREIDDNFEQKLKTGLKSLLDLQLPNVKYIKVSQP